MYRTSTTRYATGNVAIRTVLWVLALLAIAAGALSVDRVLRKGPGESTPALVVLPPPSADANRTANAVENAANTVAAPSGTAGGEIRHDAVPDVGLPAFDVARVEPSGDMVIAGRAMPGATVELLRNGKVYDRVVADASGQWRCPAATTYGASAASPMGMVRATP
jgi:hypothetical protein